MGVGEKETLGSYIPVSKGGGIKTVGSKITEMLPSKRI